MYETLQNQNHNKINIILQYELNSNSPFRIGVSLKELVYTVTFFKISCAL